MIRSFLQLASHSARRDLFETSGLDRKHWSNASPIRAVFRNAFTAAGLPYFNPHSVRKTLVQLGQRVCRSPEEYKAWSQNLGHKGVMTTFTSYGAISSARQAEIIRDLACAGSPDNGDRTILRADPTTRKSKLRLGTCLGSEASGDDLVLLAAKDTPARC